MTTSQIIAGLRDYPSTTKANCLEAADRLEATSKALTQCCDLLDEIESNNGVRGLNRAIVEYRYNGRAALSPTTTEAAQ